jgi:hypothetical protein
MPTITVYASKDKYLYQIEIQRRYFNYEILLNKLPKEHKIIRCYNLLTNENEEKYKDFEDEECYYDSDDDFYYSDDSNESDSDKIIDENNECEEPEYHDTIIDNKIIVFLEEKMAIAQIIYNLNKNLFLYDSENIVFYIGDSKDFKPIGRWWCLDNYFNFINIYEFNDFSELDGKCYSYDISYYQCITRIDKYEKNKLIKRKIYSRCKKYGRKGLNIEKYGSYQTNEYKLSFYFYPKPDLKWCNNRYLNKYSS